MGSCSSGGPNKIPGMCLANGGEVAKEDDCSRSASQALFLSNSDYVKDKAKYTPAVATNSYPVSTVAAKAKIITDPFTNDDSKLQQSISDTSPIRNRYRGDQIDCTQRATYSSSMATAICHDAEKDNLFVFPTGAWDDQGARTNVGTASTVGRSCSERGDEVVARASTLPAKQIVTDALSSLPVSNRIAMDEIDSRKQHQHRHPGRKQSVPSYRWPGEYGICIVPPPNKTVYDAYKSPRGHTDYSSESTLAISWNDQIAVSNYDHHHKPVATSTTSSGYGYREKSNSLGLAPPKGLSSVSTSSSTCHSSASSSSADCAFRRQDSGGGAKRSNSVSSCASSTVSSNVELLPSARTGAVVDDPKRHTASENRLVAAHRFLNIFSRSPMEPLNGGEHGGSARKQSPLDSDVSGDGATTTKSNNGHSNNKRPDFDRKT